MISADTAVQVFKSLTVPLEMIQLIPHTVCLKLLSCLHR